MSQQRVPSGVSTGGQYTQVPRTETDVTLAAGAHDIPDERISPVTGRRIISLPRRRVTLSPEETEQLLARIHPVDPEQMWPSRRKAIREAAERNGAMNRALR
ncbi:hypothetical protein [Pseudactinotalea terrae]|uniref:hypothetical protein n=1 Tax=Pseudactinotalea terrae TaxID=1743262 RepID=UPI0012E1BA60|nr:hypothetical protein [Pseudactinotalea terrae]